MLKRHYEMHCKHHKRKTCQLLITPYYNKVPLDTSVETAASRETAEHCCTFIIRALSQRECEECHNAGRTVLSTNCATYNSAGLGEQLNLPGLFREQIRAL